MKKTSSVFISYSSKDKKFVSRLVDAFKKHGIEYWLDAHEIKPGRDFFDAIEDGLKKADRFMVVLSGNSVESEWVDRELKAALGRETKERREIVIPVLLEQVDLPLFIQSKDYANFTSEVNFDSELRNLLEALGVEFEESSEEEDNISDKLFPDFFLPDLTFFVGRTALLEKIKEALSTKHRVVMHDISGLGKSFTSYEYVRRNHADYEKIFFIRATKEEWLESLARCGEIVSPELKNVTEQAAKAKGFKEWLERNDGWLVVYDNVDLPSELRPYVPVNLHGDCIFTSNHRDSTRLGTEVGMSILDETDAGILLYSRAVNKPHSVPEINDPEEREAFNKLLEEIDGLPVTLNSTGALIYEKDWTFDRFWKKYEQTPEIAWDSEDEFSDYKKSAGKVLSLAYGELCETKDVGHAVKIVLDSMSFISPDEIPEYLLQQILRKQDESFAEMEDPDSFWDDIREKLTAYDLLKYDRQKKSFTTHRATQRVIQSKLKKLEKEVCAALSNVLLALFPTYDHTNREPCEKYYQHVLVLAENTDKLGVESEATNELYFRLGRYQNRMGNYVLAEKFHLRGVEISETVFGKESETYARDLNFLAWVYDDQGRYDEAIEKYTETLQIDEKTIGTEHPSYATHLNNLANVYRAQGRYDEAIEKFEEALRIGERTIGKEHHDYAIRLNNLASVYSDQGRYDNAIEKFEEALLIDEKTIGKEHPNYAVHLSNLASVYSDQGRYDEAIEKYEEALSIDEKTLGKEPPSYATRLNNLASVYSEQGRYDEAIEKYTEASRIDEKTLGKEHPSYAIRLNNLANVYSNQGRYKEAIEKLEEATRITEMTLGKEHPVYAIRLSNLASIYEEQGKLRDALELYEEALRIDEKTLPPEHPYTMQDRESVERCQKLVNQVD